MVLFVSSCLTFRSNISDLERTIKRAMIIRRLLLSGNQAETSNERDKKIALLERDIKSLMFERNVRQELTNNTILEVLKIRAIEDNQNDFKTPYNRPFL
jgi:predicted nuclease of restriction endonuclease-like (RecB) superfamily